MTVAEKIELSILLRHVDHGRSQLEHCIKRINKLQDKLSSRDPSLSLKSAARLYQTYSSTLDQCLSQIQNVSNARARVDKLLPRPLGKEGPPPNGERGSLVAVLCKVDPQSPAEEWMLATVIQFVPARNCYEVEDAEIEDMTPSRRDRPAAEIKRFFVPVEKTIPLPGDDQRALERGEFKLKQCVLALFPGTTCLYPAIVVSTPSRRKRTMDYLLKFQDDNVASRACPPRFILSMNDT